MPPPSIPPRSSSRQQMRSVASPVPSRLAPTDMDIADVKLWDLRPLAITKKASILLPSNYNFRFLPGGSFKVAKWQPIYPPEICHKADTTNARSCKLPPFAPRTDLPQQNCQQIQKAPAKTNNHIPQKKTDAVLPINKSPLFARIATRTRHVYDFFRSRVQHEDQFASLLQTAEKYPQSVSRERSCLGSGTLTSLGQYIKRLFKRTTPPEIEVQKTVDQEDEDAEVIKVWWSPDPPLIPNDLQQTTPSCTEGKAQDYHRRFERLETQPFGLDFRESLGLDLP